MTQLVPLVFVFDGYNILLDNDTAAEPAADPAPAMVGRRLPRGGRPCRGAVGCPAWSLFPVRQVDTTAVRFRPSPFAASLGWQIGPASRQLKRRNVNFAAIMACGIIPDLPAIAA